MGIDAHTFKLLQYLHSKDGALGKTVTLGRQNVLLGPRAAKRALGDSGGHYCEELLQRHFGSRQVDSIDNSDYEGATILLDMNRPLPETLTRAYDTVLDFGCSEHIFDVAQVLRNITQLCNIGGRIAHAVPANGSCGHGFYQFSADLFFTWYSKENGFSDTEVYFADMCNTKNWYRVTRPAHGLRVNVYSRDELYILVTTTRAEEKSETPAQQSDYVFEWNRQSATIPPHQPGRLAGIRELLSGSTVLNRAVSRIDALFSPNSPKHVRRHPLLTSVASGKPH